jgi:pyruvate carboxylase
MNAKTSKNGDIGAPLQGRLTRILVKEGDTVKKNQPLFVIEAMKMESIVAATKEGTVSKVVLNESTTVEQDDCVLELA